MINWHDEIERLYKEFNPQRLDALLPTMRSFSGYEESLWYALVNKYRVPERRPTVRPVDEGAGFGSARQRVIRMYAHYAPHRLSDVQSTMALMREDGPGRVFALLLKKYGEEPPVKPATIPERVLVLYATYGALDRVSALPALLQTYEGMEDVLMRRLTNELGPEPHTAEAGDPRDPRERLRRIFSVYSPDSVRRIDSLLARYKGNELQMFAMLQRQYGREPSEYDAQLYRDRAERERIRSQADQERRVADTARDKEAKKAAKELEISRKMLQVGAAMWDVGTLMPLDPLRGDATRPDCFMKLRDHMSHSDQLTYDKAKALIADIFRCYERWLVPHVDELLAPRYDASETNEFFALIDCMYANAVPVHLRANLRSVVSLLEMKYGSTLEEIWVAGGVEKFLARIDPASRDEWIVYLTMLHGSVTESELAARNRLRAFYLHYNPGTPVTEVDGLLRSLGNDTASMYSALLQHYGPEPEPMAVDMAAIQRILAKHDPDKLSMLDLVVEAHCLVGDSSAAVVRRVERTYGPTPTAADEVLARMAAEELTARFDIFANELRLRLVLGRKKTALEHPELDVLSSIISGTPQFHDANTLRLQQQMEGGLGPLSDLIEDEEARRAQMLEAERTALKVIVDMYAGLLSLVPTDANIELDELLRRHMLCDDEVLVREHYRHLMEGELKELQRWLQGRLIWRAKWRRDEELAEQRKRDVELRERLLREAEEAPPAPVVYSDEHVVTMQRLQNQLHEQAKRVLEFNSAVHSARHGPRDSMLKKAEVEKLLRGDYHRGCVFHKSDYVMVEPRLPSPAPVASDDEEAEEASLGGQDWEAMFLHQCHDYVRSLLQTYEPLRLPLLGELIRQHFGREYDLIAALEQQYNVRNWRGQNLQQRVEDYYRRVAPGRLTVEVPELLRRFSHRPDLLWAYLKSRYGADPEARSPQVRQFLVNRLSRYLARLAPERLPETEILIDRCEDHNCDTLFEQLTQDYGPEEPDAECEAIRLKLVSFYKARRMHHVLQHTRMIAKRFVGRQALLKEIIRRKFNASLDTAAIDPEDVQL
jgi:hypothetical protein